MAQEDRRLRSRDVDTHRRDVGLFYRRRPVDVVAWIDPVCANGVPSDSDEALVILCPVLGPSATLVLHRLSRYATAGPTVWEPGIFAATFGMSKNSATGLATKAITRLARFGFAMIGPSALAVRTHVPPLPQRWISALPEYLRDAPVADAA